MNISFSLQKNWLIIKLSGELDHHNTNYIRKKIDNKISQEYIKHIVFNLKNLTFTDSSGVGMILGRYKKIKKRGGITGVVNLNPQVKRVFEISGLFKVIKYFNSIKEAIDYFEEV